MQNEYIYTYYVCRYVCTHYVAFMSFRMAMHADTHTYMCMGMNKISLKEYMKKLFLNVCFQEGGLSSRGISLGGFSFYN